MRVRTAHVELRNQSGLEGIFSKAVDRHLAWIIGSGSPTEELTDVATSHGYGLWHPDLEDFEPVSYWVSVRLDLLDHDTWTDGGNHILFGTTAEGLGEVELGVEKDESEWTDKSRIRDVRIGELLHNGDHTYIEFLYTVEPLKN